MWPIYLTYTSLLASVLLLWVPVKKKIKPWQILLCISLILSIISNVANVIAIFSIILLYCAVSAYHQCDSKWKIFLGVIVFMLGLALELHFVPGFHNLLVLNKVQITPDAMPFSLYLNLDKTVVGLIIIGITLRRASTIAEWRQLIQQVVYRLPFIVLIILTLSFVFGYIKFAPKLPQNLGIWVMSNLFFASFAEEALFRGFFQESLSTLRYQYAQSIAVFIPAMVFGLIHYPGGIKYVILATVAGVLYGWVYKVTKRIEASILAHFLLNLAHILFFTYPALK